MNNDEFVRFSNVFYKYSMCDFANKLHIINPLAELI